MPTILIVDDDLDVRRSVAAIFEAEGYRSRSVASGMEAFELLSSDPPDVVILEVALPGVSGFDVLEVIQRHPEPPAVIFLSSSRAEENIVRGLSQGADDYVIKPCSARELVARVGTRLRKRGASALPEIIEHGDLRIDAASREVWLRGEPVEMTAKEFDLLRFLAASPGRVFTRKELLVTVWKSSGEWQQAGTVTEHVRRLRLKIESDFHHPTRILTVRGVGYRFEPAAS